MITNRQIIEIIETNEYYKNLITVMSVNISLLANKEAKLQREQIMEQYNKWLGSEVK